MTDELTDDGIRTDSPDVTLLDYLDAHGEPVHVGPECVVFADRNGYELGEWADALEMDRSEFSRQMRELARGATDWDWSTSDPVVFDARTFTRGGFGEFAMLLWRGASPAEAVDFLATERKGMSQTDWSEFRGVSQQNVSGNVSQAKDALGE
jgi:hypothetical protein